MVWRLDRLGRSLKHLIETITELNNRKIGFKSIQENIDTTTSGGKLVFHIFGALAEFERDIIRERTQAGLQAARARGRKGGRPKAKSLNTPKKITLAQSLYNDKNNTIDDICKTLNISRATLYTQTLQDDRYFPAVTHYQPAPEAVLVAFHCQQRTENISIRVNGVYSDK